MSDNTYCYPDSDVLKNKLNIYTKKELLEAEITLTSIRLQELQKNPIMGHFDFKHLKDIHRYIFQDVYEWAGTVRTVEIGKGNIFCLTMHIDSYADAVFKKYFRQCDAAKNNTCKFINTFAENYGDLNALHPFRDGNGRAQREFARVLCLECGYDFSLANTTHAQMLAASKLSFDMADNSGLVKIFEHAVRPIESTIKLGENLVIKILTSDDLDIQDTNYYEYYTGSDFPEHEKYDNLFIKKINQMADD